MKKVAIVFIITVFGVLLGFMIHGAWATEEITHGYDINGYSIGYYENNEVVFQNYGDGINENSMFELASNGKVVGAYIALKLVDEGKLSLEDKIAPFLDDRLLTDDERMYDITLRQLLCHTAGFSPSFELGIDKKIYADPGEEFCYSGVGYIYLQNVIENVSGMTMEQAARHYVFEPLGMESSTFEHAKTVTPYMDLSSVVLYIFAVFIMVFIILLLIAFVAGKMTKFRFLSFRNSLVISFIVAGMINTWFLLFVFVSKAAVIFWMCFALMGFGLLITRKHIKIFYAVIPVIIAFILISGLTIPVSIPVTNDIVERQANCAYTLKSTGEDMSVFCGELMKQYHSKEGAVREMFSDAVMIDTDNRWGLGIAIESEREGETYWHSGINPGF